MPGALVKLPEHAPWAASGVSAGEAFASARCWCTPRPNSPPRMTIMALPTPRTRSPCRHGWSPRKRRGWSFRTSTLPPIRGSPRDSSSVRSAMTRTRRGTRTRTRARRGSLPGQHALVGGARSSPCPSSPTCSQATSTSRRSRGSGCWWRSASSTSAWKRFLDWRAEARLPADAQGVHLLVGKTTQSNTSMKHYYEEGNPLFLLKRTHEKDTITLKLREGALCSR